MNGVENAINVKIKTITAKKGKVRRTHRKYIVSFECPQCKEKFENMRVPLFVKRLQCDCGIHLDLR